MAKTDYERYIRTDELLALQKSVDTLTCEDEMQFQTVHQVAELWMKLIAFEVGRYVRSLDADDWPAATWTLKRVAMIQRLLIEQIDLLDTMSPSDYLTVRTGLGNGSGQESPGFKTLLRLPGETMWPAFCRCLERSGKTLIDIYRDPPGNRALFDLAEGLVDYDQLLQTWRYRHLMLVYRIIGDGTPSLKGKPSELLAKGMKQRFFPALWQVRNEIFAEWTEEMKTKGKDAGYH